LDGNPKLRRGKKCYSNRLVGAPQHIRENGKELEWSNCKRIWIVFAYSNTSFCEQLTQYANGTESTNLPTSLRHKLEVQQELPGSDAEFNTMRAGMFGATTTNLLS